MKVALIGAGTMAGVHAESYQNIPDAELVGIVDRHEGRGKKLAMKASTTYFASLDQLLERQEVDVVDVCVPTPFHKEYVVQAARAKRHVICEKPVARTLDDAREMIEVCRDEGVRFFVAHVVRFFGEYKRMKDLVLDGAIGKVGTARAKRGGSFPSATDDWYANADWSGGLIVDLMIHDFDYLRSVFGDVERVYAKSLLGRELNRVDHALVSLRFENGVIAHVEGTWAEPEGFSTQLEFAGTDGVVIHDSKRELAVQAVFRQSDRDDVGVNVPGSPISKSPYQAELEHFLHCIRTGEASTVTADDAYRALEISLAALESVQSGRSVELRQGVVK